MARGWVFLRIGLKVWHPALAEAGPMAHSALCMYPMSCSNAPKGLTSIPGYSSNNNNNNPRRRLVWHRKGDLRLHDNDLYSVPGSSNQECNENHKDSRTSTGGD